jgi:hypothetical protein
MTDPVRTDRHADAGDVPERDREARIEELLVHGLDHYFDEQYELAINIWTRVLFIDRGHARARAYIERARSALAERQRKGDELLHTGEVAFGRGDADSARQLIASAVDHGAPGDEALALLARIDRLETASSHRIIPAVPRTRAHVGTETSATGHRYRRLQWIAIGLLCGALLGAALVVALVQQDVIAWPASAQRENAAPPALTPALPVPSWSELALARAAALHQAGRLREALDLLEPIPAGDPLRGRSDELRATIQRQLLGTARSQGRRP